MGERLANATFLEIATTRRNDLPDNVLLPHEEAAVERLVEQKRAQFRQIVEDKQSVTGGDDWHDGAFRATDGEANVVTSSLAALHPYLSATVVEYPEDSEQRVTLGSRVLIAQKGFEFPVDVVGIRTAYPADVIDPDSGQEVESVSIDSPLGKSILGKVAGETSDYRQGERLMTVSISRISQTAVAEYFMSEAGAELSLPEMDE